MMRDVGVSLLAGTASQGIGGWSRFSSTGLRVNVQDRGARPGGANARPAFQEALDEAVFLGATLFIPSARYFFRDDEPLRITGPCILEGEGFGSEIVVGSTVASTVDVFRVLPSVAGIRLIRLSDFRVTAEAGTPGRHALHIDLTLANAFVANIEIARLWLGALGGKGIKLTNPANVDGFFTSAILGCFVQGGIEMERAGDSLDILRCVLSGANAGIDVSMVTGASQIHIGHNNITNAGGAIILRSGDQVKIYRNQIEQVVADTGGETACVVVKGDVGEVASVEIEGNNIQAAGFQPYCVEVDNAANVHINKNVMNCANADDHINVKASAVRTYIGTENDFRVDNAGGAAARIDDAGVQTFGPKVTISAFSNLWVAFDAVNFPVRYSKNEAGMVALEGKVKDGTAVAGTTIFNLPAGFRPTTVALDFAVDSNNAHAVVRITNTGNVQIIAGSNLSLSFAGISFKVDL